MFRGLFRLILESFFLRFFQESYDDDEEEEDGEEEDEEEEEMEEEEDEVLPQEVRKFAQHQLPASTSPNKRGENYLGCKNLAICVSGEKK